MYKINKILEGLIPGFLRRIDTHLLENKPLIWRTRIHFFVFYSGFLLNFILLLIGFNINISSKNLVSESDLNLLVFWSRIFLFLVAVYWIYRQWQYPPGEIKRKEYLKISFINSLCLFLLYINSIVLSYPLITKTAKAVPDVKLIQEFEFHSNNDFWVCTEKASDSLLTISIKDRIGESLNYFGIEHSRISVIDSTDNESSCTVGGLYSIYIAESAFPEERKLLSFEIVRHFDKANMAKDFLKGEGGYFVKYVSNIPLWYLLCLVLAFGVTIIQIPSIFWERIKLMFKYPFYPRLIKFRSFKKHKKFDIENNPVLWSTQINKYTVDLLNVSLLVMMILLSVSYLDLEIIFLNLRSKRLISLFGIGIVSSFYLIWYLHWHDIQSKIKIPNLSFNEYSRLFIWSFAFTSGGMGICCGIFASLIIYTVSISKGSAFSFNHYLFYYTILFHALGSFFLLFSILSKLFDSKRQIYLTVWILPLIFIFQLLINDFNLMIPQYLIYLLIIISFLCIGSYIGGRNLNSNIASWANGFGLLQIIFISLLFTVYCVAFIYNSRNKTLVDELTVIIFIFFSQPILLLYFSWPFFNRLQRWATQPKQS